MPYLIHALFQDQSLSKIKSLVESRKEKVPYVLLPVRLETRFMEVPDIPEVDLPLITGFLDKYYQLHDTLLELSYKPGVHSLEKAKDAVKGLADSVTEDLQLTGEEKSLVVQAIRQLQTETEILQKRVFSTPPTRGRNPRFATRRLAYTAAEIAGAKKLIHGIGEIEEKLKAIKPLKKVNTDEVHGIHDELLRLCSETDRWVSGRNKMPFTDFKNKKDLYKYLDRTLQAINALSARIAAIPGKGLPMNKNQVSRMDTLYKQIAGNLRKSGTVVKKLHKDKNWLEYVKKDFSPAAAKASRLLQARSKTFLTKSAKMPMPKTGIEDFNTVKSYLAGINAIVRIKRFNLNPEMTYTGLTTFRKNLESSVQTLQKIREERNSQTALPTKVTKLFDQVSVQLNAAITRTESYPVLNKSQEFGRNLVTSFEKDIARASLADWTRPIQPHPGIVGSIPKTKKQLWVRIYPDDIFAQTHEPELSPNEIKAGKSFWKNWYCASGDKELELSAWRILCGLLGTRRASWVARSLDPRKLGQNHRVLARKPSMTTLQILEYAGQCVTALKSVEPKGTLVVWLSGSKNLQHLNVAHNLLEKMASLFASVRKENSVLGDRLRFQLIQTGSALEHIFSKVSGLSPTTRRDPLLTRGLTLLEGISSQFMSVQNAFNKVTWLEFKVFVDEQPDVLVFPDVPERDSEWTKAPHTECLPQRFAVIAKRGKTFVHIKVGRQVPVDLQLGLNPEKFGDESLFTLDENQDLKLDPGLEWMAFYPKAVENGLGITLDITSEDYDKGFDQLVVLGVHEGDATQSAKKLESLIENHLYSPDGMSILKIGTPTNNTSDQPSGYDPDANLEEMYDIEIGGKGWDPKSPDWDRLDGQIFGEVLSLPDSLMTRIPGANNREMNGTRAMNKILWPATMGHQMEEMWDHFFTYDNIRRTEQFFTDWVSGRGHLPSVRIGEQPYGMLVTTAWSQFEVAYDLPSVTLPEAANIKPWEVANANLEKRLQQRFDIRLWEVLKFLKHTWNDLVKLHVIHAGNIKVDGNDDENRFVEMLGLQAHSIEYFYRYGVNLTVGMEGNHPGFTTNFEKDDEYGPIKVFNRVKDLASGGIYKPSFDFLDEELAVVNSWKPFQIDDARFSRIQKQIQENRMFSARLLEDSLSVDNNLVQEDTDKGEMLDLMEGKASDYITWILQQTSAALLGSNDFGNRDKIPDVSLLFLLLRQGLLQAYQKTALDLLQLEGMMKEEERRIAGSRDKYLTLKWVANKYVRVYSTKWHFLFKTLKDLTEDYKLPMDVRNNDFYKYIDTRTKAISGYLDSIRNNNPVFYKPTHKAHFDRLKIYRESMAYLKNYSVGELERLMAEHIDLCSYRLDAWHHAYAAKRVFQQRKNTKTGIYLGAYGYVENLKPDMNKAKTDKKLDEFKLPKGKPVYHDPDNQGFIHAPSISHAVTAAVLRNAYINNREEGDVENRLAVNLSSSRIRMALHLMEGIRNGQETGAILGFQFERGLHDRHAIVELDRFIQPFRKAYPLQQDVAETATNDKPPYVSLVPDGLAMLDDVYKAIDWVNPETNASKDKTVAQLLKENNYSKLPAKIKKVIDDEALPADQKEKAYNQIIEEIDRMADAFDALGDVALSESVYQMVAGNHVRAGAVMDALADGRAIPEPEVILTPRTGKVVTHRLILNLKKKSTSEFPAGWPFTGSVRAKTEPAFNCWLGETLGNAADIRFVIRTKETGQTAEVLVDKTLADFDLQPIDIYCMPGQMDELVQTLIGFYRLQEQDFHSVINIGTEDVPSGDTDHPMSLSEMFTIIRHIRNMMSNARMAGASDFRKADEEESLANAGMYEIAEFEARINAARTSLQLFISQVEAESYISSVADGSVSAEEIILTTADLNDIIQNLGIGMYMGFPNAMNLPVMGHADPTEGQRACLKQLIGVLKEAKKRKAEADKAFAALPPASNQRLRVEKLDELGTIVFGKGFRALASFSKHDVSHIIQQLDLPVSQKISRFEGALSVENWIRQLSQIRPVVSELHKYRRMADSHDLPEVNIQPAQLPWEPGDYWYGLSYPANFEKEGDVTSLVLLNDHIVKDTVQCALLLDEWHEVIPGNHETTGVSFHYNQPGATAPQAVLVAVTPHPDEKWTWDDLVHTITDTMEMAKIRAVEPDHLEMTWLNQIIPSVYAEVVPPQMRNEDSNPLGVQAVLDFANVKVKEE